jgi:hypothetical protein
MTDRKQYLSLINATFEGSTTVASTEQQRNDLNRYYIKNHKNTVTEEMFKHLPSSIDMVLSNSSKIFSNL